MQASEQAVAILRRTMPAGHPDIARGLTQYGSALRLAKRYEESEAVLKEALVINAAARGTEAPETLAFEQGRFND